MKLNHGLHLAYCTNIHRGETWLETFDALKKYTLAVRQQVALNKPYAIGLRLSNRAARELSEPAVLTEFQRWLTQNHCYVFTINGFPYGQFHGARVKEKVYLPDWTSPDRVAYTNLLFDLLAQLVPPGIEGSVSTVPCGFKELVTTSEALKTIRENIWQCVEHIARVSHQTGRKLHLGLEPEPLCLLETSVEVVQFFERMRAEHPNDPRLVENLGVNYDTCHLGVEFEEPQNALGALCRHGIKISKLHLSSALKVKPSIEARAELAKFADDIYLHQVIVRRPDASRAVYRDLSDALAGEPKYSPDEVRLFEWRIHFHVPLHSSPTPVFDNTTDHLLGALDILRSNPALCSHLEMETYTWEVLPPNLKSRNVVEQLVAEYAWTLARLAERGLCE
jgi:hypothetical protein